jgi:hypothetical protein
VASADVEEDAMVGTEIRTDLHHVVAVEATEHAVTQPAE